MASKIQQQWCVEETLPTYQQQQKTDFECFKTSSRCLWTFTSCCAAETAIRDDLCSSTFKSSLAEVVGVSASPTGVYGSTHIKTNHISLVFRNSSQYLEVGHYWTLWRRVSHSWSFVIKPFFNVLISLAGVHGPHSEQQLWILSVVGPHVKMPSQ